jgi:tRNA 5-methylaminomethyl-2-thiouridine biosynthesis bifunctional protein
MQTPWFYYPCYHWNKKHAIIIGGGIAGCQSAWHLVQTGWHVTLIERHHKLATEASGNIAGAIMPKMTALPSLGEDFYRKAFCYTLNQLTHLQASDKKINYEQCGVLQLAHNLREEKRWNALQQRGFNDDFLQCLDRAQTQHYSGITSPYKSIYFPQGGWIDPKSYCQALVDHPNCSVLLHSKALQLQQHQQYWRVFTANNTLLAEAEVVVIANGKDLKQFKQTSDLPIMPVLGQTSQASATPASQKLHTVIGHEGYLTPAINGQHIFGATFERNQAHAIISSQADTFNQQRLHHYLADFSDTLGTIKSSHAAIRMTTPDRFPYAGALINPIAYQQHYADLHQGKHWKKYPIGRYLQGLFVLAGLGSRGLTTATYCASVVADIINNKQPEGKLITALHTGRFMIRDLKRNKG